MTPRTPRPASRSMGRPLKQDADKKARLSITIRPGLMKAVEILANVEHRTISGTIEAALSEYVNARKSMIKKLTT